MNAKLHTAHINAHIRSICSFLVSNLNNMSASEWFQINIVKYIAYVFRHHHCTSERDTSSYYSMSAHSDSLGT